MIRFVVSLVNAAEDEETCLGGNGWGNGVTWTEFWTDWMAERTGMVWWDGGGSIVVHTGGTIGDRSTRDVDTDSSSPSSSSFADTTLMYMAQPLDMMDVVMGLQAGGIRL